MRSLRAVVCAVVLALLASVLVVDPASAKPKAAGARSDFGVSVKSDPIVPKFDARKALRDREKRVAAQGRRAAAPSSRGRAPGVRITGSGGKVVKTIPAPNVQVGRSRPAPKRNEPPWI